MNANELKRVVTRKIVNSPSNSKSPGSTHHVDIDGRRFECSPEQRGTGWATCEIDHAEAVITVGATFFVGKRRKRERIIDTAKVHVTGEPSDVVELAATYISSQEFRVEFRGVRRIT